MTMKSLASKPAFISLAFVLVLGALVLMTVLFISLGGIDSLLETEYEVKFNELQEVMEACTEEALLELNQDEDYPGGDFTVNGIECSVAITGTGDARTMTATADQDGVHVGGAQLTIDVSVSPIEITNWEPYFTP